MRCLFVSHINYYEKTALNLPLGMILSVSSGKGFNVRKLNNNGLFPVYGGNGIVGSTSDYIVEFNTIIIGRVGANCGCVHKTLTKSFVTDNALIVSIKTSLVDTDYLVYALKSIDYSQLISSTAQPLISGKIIYPIKIRIPSFKEQRSIVNRLNNIINII